MFTQAQKASTRKPFNYRNHLDRAREDREREANFRDSESLQTYF